MKRIYTGQSSLRITLRTFCNLSGVKFALIKYRKPNGKTGEFSASVFDSVKGVIYYECTQGDIDVSGWWSFWAYIIFDDARTAVGQAAKVYVWEQGM